MSIFTLFYRAIRLRCPACGQGRLFDGWFTMEERCSACGASFVREPGFYLGSIYVNYGLTALIVTGTYVTLNFSGAVDGDLLLWPLTAFTFLFPVWFFRYARSIWLGMDYRIDPDRQRSDRLAADAKVTQEKLP